MNLTVWALIANNVAWMAWTTFCVLPRRRRISVPQGIITTDRYLSRAQARELKQAYVAAQAAFKPREETAS